MQWDAFRAACPEIGRLAEERFRADELVILGTVRPDGASRVSPCEVDFAERRLLLGMMWQSLKARDLLRDPRITIHSVPSDRLNVGGDIKLYGVAIDEQDSDVRDAYRDEIRRRIHWAPDEPRFHLFSVDVQRAAYIRFGDDRIALAWDAQRGFRRTRHPDDTSEP